MEKHDVESPWYKRCVEVGSENVEALEEVTSLALSSRESSRSYFASLWSLRFDATQDDKSKSYPELLNSDLRLLAKGLVLLEKKLREKNRTFTFGSTSPVVPVCRLLEFRLLPEGRDDLNDLYVWIHSHKDEANPYTPFGSLAYSGCITLDEREAVESQETKDRAKRVAHRERVTAEQGRLSKQRRQDKAAAKHRKKETREKKRSDAIIIDYGEEGIYYSKSWLKRCLHRVKNTLKSIRARLVGSK